VNAVEPQGASAPAEHGVVISRGLRVYLRTMVPADLQHFAAWVDDPFLERMVGSEFLHSYKHVWDKAPAFYEAILNDPTQVALMIEAYQGWTKPVGVVRLFNIHLLEGYAFLETILTDLLQIFFWYDNTRRCRCGAIKGHKVWPGLTQVKAYGQRINHLDTLDLCL